MDAMKLEPLAARIRFMSDFPRNDDDWCRIIGKFFQKIAASCEILPQEVIIGHIKGLALFSGGEHFRVSVISSSYQPEFDASSKFEADMVPLTINVLVYGLKVGSIEQIVRDEVASLNDLSGIEAEIEAISAADHTHVKSILSNMPDGQTEED